MAPLVFPPGHQKRQDAVTSFKMEEEVSASLADPFVARRCGRAIKVRYRCWVPGLVN